MRREPFGRFLHLEVMSTPNQSPSFFGRLRRSLGGAANSDRELVGRARARDPLAFELIMRRHNQRLYRLARALLRDPAEAEDVVQETYLRAFARLGDFVGPDGFGAWLGRIAVNEALGRLRRRARVVPFERPGAPVDQDALAALASDRPGPERLAANAELRRLLEQAIDGLPDDFRTVFMLRAVEGLGVAETAEVLSIPPATVKTRFHRARRLLQESLGSRLDALLPSTFEFAGRRCDRIVAGVLARLDEGGRPTD